MFSGKCLSGRDCNAGSLFGSRGSSDSSAEFERHSSGESGFSDDESEPRQFRERNRKHRSYRASSICSSNASSTSDYSRAYDSDDEVGGLEGFLQMGCMDAMFLPRKTKTKSNKPLIKVNENGERELNVRLKGPLALGFEAQMREHAEMRRTNSTNSISYFLQDGTRVPEFHKNPHFRSLMSLSHESSSSSDTDNDHRDDSDALSENLIESPRLPLSGMEQPRHTVWNNQHQQQYTYTGSQQEPFQYPNQKNESHYYQQQQFSPEQKGLLENIFSEMDITGAVSSVSSDCSDSRQEAPESRNSCVKEVDTAAELTEGMPSQIIVEHKQSFEEESCLTMENALAPDPPESSLARIREDDYSCTSSEKESNASMVARGSMDSQSHGDEIPSPKTDEEIVVPTKPSTLSSRNGGKVFERWKKANIQRLNSSQKNPTSLDEVASSEERPLGANGAEGRIADTDEEHKEKAEDSSERNSVAGVQDDGSVGSDQATHSSIVGPFQPRVQLELKTDADFIDEVESESTTADPLVPNDLTEQSEAPFDEPKTPTGEPEKLFDEPGTPFDEPMAFDSILTRRIESRRASKLKGNDKSSVIDVIDADRRSASTISTKDLNGNELSSQKGSDNVSEKSSSLPSAHNGVAAPEVVINDNISVTDSSGMNVDQNGASTVYSHSSSTKEAVTTGLFVRDYPSLENNSLDKEDVENQAPSVPPKGNDDFISTLERKEPSYEDCSHSRTRNHEKTKNPFEDDDFYKGDGAVLSLGSTSSFGNFVLQPIGAESIDAVAGVSSPSASSREAAPMIPSPRHSANSVVSPRSYGRTNPGPGSSSPRHVSSPVKLPRIYGRTHSRLLSNPPHINNWNESIESSNSRSAATTVKESSRGNPTELYGTRETVSYGPEFDDFFEANMNVYYQ
eukprot:CAMPEP_0172360852 /NCGR_PEP_ID=MMETSP1060-20121228/4796_1 /TAXON_ID=37318 /ORGANISM="Pseudo-nitzschia pungens, Strain cf. cingulata" /LENGTH=907 /DNA_ID=CAMNT_0013082943 /DNA_START=154 /DNA_END=2877 /DNA_ORIENTATION=-